VSGPIATPPTGNLYDKYGTANPVERWLVGAFFDRLDQLLPAATPARILEVGTGEGEVARRVTARYPGVPVVALDLPDHELGANVFGDAHRLPFPDGAFDLVLAIEVLEHLPDPATALGELARVARPGATAVVSVPSEPLWRALNLARLRYITALGNTPGHLQHWTPWAFRSLVSRSFDVQVARHPLPWTIVAATRR
jgi:ubiquinone/menaquinone biosynthesis C-methylase UbiE